MAECFFFAGHQRVACTRVSTIRFTDTSQPNGRLCAGRGRLFSRDELERRMSGRSPGQAELWRGAMNRPEDSAEEKSHLTASDLAHLEEILRQATDAQAIRNAQPQKRENAINPVRSSRAGPTTSRLPKLPPAANLRLPQQAANRSQPRPADDPFAGIKRRPPSSLDPEIMPLPPRRSRRLGRLLIGSILMVGFAAVVAYGIATFSPFQPDNRGEKAGSDAATVGQAWRELARVARQRLVAEDQQAFANEPILLAIVPVPAASSGSLSLRGLVHGTRLSAGKALNENDWELPLRDLGSAYVYAPMNFVGVMSVTIALLSPSNEVLDSRPIRLEWIAKTDSPQPPNERDIDRQSSSTAIKQESSSELAKQEVNPETASAKQQINPQPANADAVKIVDPQEAAALIERGRDLLRNGDVASAQLAFRRLAEAGKAEAALALATTYDPRYLVQHNLVGIVGDEEKARTWYRRAKELGSREADRFLQSTSTK
jgi:hypothetical protein